MTLSVLIFTVQEGLEAVEADATRLPDGKLLRGVVEGEDGQGEPGLESDVLELRNVYKNQEL